MAFNGVGTYNLPLANVVTGTTISSTWANTTLADIATGLSTTVCKDGQQTTTASVPVVFGITGGSTGAFAVSASSKMTNTLQPSFLATGGAATNCTGDGTVFNPIVYGTEVFDQNGDYNAGTGIFTAPVTGRYLLSAGLAIEGLLAAHNGAVMYIETSNRNYNNSIYTVAAGANIFTGISGSMSVVADMDAGDTAIVKIEVNGGTKVVDLTGGVYGRFSGCLLA